MELTGAGCESWWLPVCCAQVQGTGRGGDRPPSLSTQLWVWITDWRGGIGKFSSAQNINIRKINRIQTKYLGENCHLILDVFIICKLILCCSYFSVLSSPFYFPYFFLYISMQALSSPSSQLTSVFLLLSLVSCLYLSLVCLSPVSSQSTAPPSLHFSYSARHSFSAPSSHLTCSSTRHHTDRQTDWAEIWDEITSLLMPALLRHKDTTQGTQSPQLGANLAFRFVFITCHKNRKNLFYRWPYAIKAQQKARNGVV